MKTKKAKKGSVEKAQCKAQLKSLQQEISRNIMEANSSHYAEKINKYKGDMKKTWGTINQIINRRRAKTNFPPFLKLIIKKSQTRRRLQTSLTLFFCDNRPKISRRNQD